jgi:hypothetical protein
MVREDGREVAEATVRASLAHPGLARALLIIPFVEIAVPCLMYRVLSTGEPGW